MEEAVLAAGDNKFGVDGKGALYNGGFIEEIGEFMNLIPFKGVEHKYAVIGGGQHH